MALSDAEKAQIRRYLMVSLTWPEFGFHVDQALGNIDQDAASVAETQKVLAKITAVEGSLDTQIDVLVVKKIDGGTELSLGVGVEAALRLGWMYVIQLGGLLGVKPHANPFGNEPGRPFFADPGGWSGGGGLDSWILPRG